MTSVINFTIDGALAPADANKAYEELKEWLTIDKQGVIDISPLPDAVELPTQPALQLLYAAAFELSGKHDIAECMHPDTFALCDRLLGNRPLKTMSKSQELGANNG